MEKQVQHFLSENKIEFVEYQVPAGSFPPPDQFWIELKIKRCKNLFFRDNHGKNHFLVVFDYYKQLDIKMLSKNVGRGSLSFASGWRLEKYLNLTPGFLSVFGILNDPENHVKIIIDKDLDQAEKLSFLPNTKGGSFICLDFKNLEKFVKLSGNEYKVIELGE